jgi:hypothetical protein
MIGMRLNEGDRLLDSDRSVAHTALRPPLRAGRRVMPLQGKNIWRLCKTYGCLIGVPSSLASLPRACDRGGCFVRTDGRSENADPPHLPRLRIDGERYQRETDCQNGREPDQPHGTPR